MDYPRLKIKKGVRVKGIAGRRKVDKTVVLTNKHNFSAVHRIMKEVADGRKLLLHHQFNTMLNFRYPGLCFTSPQGSIPAFQGRSRVRIKSLSTFQGME